jgi:hypothetical protein
VSMKMRHLDVEMRLARRRRRAIRQHPLVPLHPAPTGQRPLPSTRSDFPRQPAYASAG